MTWIKIAVVSTVGLCIGLLAFAFEGLQLRCLGAGIVSLAGVPGPGCAYYFGALLLSRGFVRLPMHGIGKPV